MTPTPFELDFVLTQGAFTLELHERFEAHAVALVGPSGAGKTTVLDAIAGLRRPDRGAIAIAGHTLFRAPTVDLPPHERRVGYVPQEAALFPHMDVAANIAYGRRRATGRRQTDLLALLEIDELVRRDIAGLSGGERQRVAIARALASEPDVLLLDEPLAAVDPALRGRILPYIERVRDELAVPIVYVSHAADEVARVADRVIRLAGGRVRA